MDEWLTWYNKPRDVNDLDKGFTKPPLTRRSHTVKDGELGCSIKKAMDDVQFVGELGGGVGFKLSDRNDIVFLDIDHVNSLNQLPENFKAFIMIQDTYMELSPSGKGLRIVFICKDKENLPNKAKLVGMDGELFVRKLYVTITGNHMSGEEIKEVSAYQLEQWFKLPKESAEIIELPVDFNYPDISIIRKNLEYCKLNQNELVKKAYKKVFREEYDHYEYWLRIMQSCHYYATVTNQMNEMSNLVNLWSQTDKEFYANDDGDEVMAKWASFGNDNITNPYTHKTLMSLGSLLQMNYPDQIVKKGEKTGFPQVNSMNNFEYLMEYYNVKIFQNLFNSNYYIKADKNIVDKYLLWFGKATEKFGMIGPFGIEDLKTAMWKITLDNKYNNIPKSTINTVFQSYIHGKMESCNTFKLWLETPYNELPDNMKEPNSDPALSTFENFLNTIEYSDQQNMTLVEVYWRIFFFEMMMPIYNPERIYSMRSFVPILIGPEACRKSTFIKMLAPKHSQKEWYTNANEVLGEAKSQRDFQRTLINSVIVGIDEFESFYNLKFQAQFKKIVTQDDDAITEIFQTEMLKPDRNAVIIGTTNKRQFMFEQNSNRRFALMDVRWCDTDKLNEIRLHTLYNDFLKRGYVAMTKGKWPWKPTREEQKLQYIENEKHRTKNELEDTEGTRRNLTIVMTRDDLLAEFFNTPIQKIGNDIDNKLLMTPNHFRIELLQNGRIHSFKECKHFLQKISAHYTDTLNSNKIWLNYNQTTYIQDGEFHQADKTYYAIPPLKEGYETNF